MPYRLRSSRPVADELRRAAREQAERALASVDDPDVDPDGAVHDVRKRCKKIRAALRLARPGIGEKAYRRGNRFFRDTARLAAAARDDAVVLQTFDHLLESLDRTADAERFLPLRDEVVTPRDAQRQERRDPREAAGRAAVELREGLALLDALPFDNCSFGDVAEALRRSYQDGRRALNAAMKSLDSEDLHEWRKRAKDHWHHVRLLRDAWKGPMAARRRELKRLTEVQGDLNDLAMLDARLVALSEGNGGGEILTGMSALIERRRTDLLAIATPLGRRVYAEKPKAFTRRIESWWNIGAASRDRPPGEADAGSRRVSGEAAAGAPPD